MYQGTDPNGAAVEVVERGQGEQTNSIVFWEDGRPELETPMTVLDLLVCGWELTDAKNRTGFVSDGSKSNRPAKRL